MRIIGILSPLWLLIFCFFAGNCNNQHDSSEYGDLLSRPPYANLTDSIEHNNSDPDLYYRRGMLLFRNNNYSPALADLRTAWAMRKSEVYALAISNLFLQGKPDSAFSFLQEALNLFPESISLHANLIQALSDQHKPEQALAACDEILQKYPHEVSILLMKSDLLDQKNDTMQARRVLEQAYTYAPFNQDLCYNLAFKYAQTKDPRTLVLCDSLIHNDTLEKKAEPYYFIGVYYANLGDRVKALGYFNKAIQNDYNFLDAYMEKGKILYEEKKNVDAIKTLELALTISPSYADGYYWLGKCQESLGQKSEARANYQRAYGLDKSLIEAKEAADKL